MAKQSKPKKVAKKKTLLEKIGDKAAHLKEDIIAGKDHLVEIAGDAFDSVKSSIQQLTEKKKIKSKKAAKPAVKTAAAKSARPVAKKAVKTAVKKAAKPIAKVPKPVAKKAAPKKVAKKAAGKK